MPGPAGGGIDWTAAGTIVIGVITAAGGVIFGNRERKLAEIAAARAADADDRKLASDVEDDLRAENRRLREEFDKLRGEMRTTVDELSTQLLTCQGVNMHLDFENATYRARYGPLTDA